MHSLPGSENIDPLLIPHTDISPIISVEVPYRNLSANAGIRVYEMRDKFDSMLFGPLQFKPVENRGLIGPGVTSTMRPPALARYEIH